MLLIILLIIILLIPVHAAGAGDREVGGCIKRLTSLPSPRLSFPSLWRGGCASFIPPTLLLTYTTYLFNHLPTSALSCVCEPGHMPKLIIKQSRQNPTTTYTNSWWKLASRCLMPNFQSILPIVNCTKCCKQSILSSRKRRGSYEFMDSGEKNREALYRKWALGRYKQARSGPRASRSKRR